MHMNGANAETAYDLLEDRIALYKYRPGMRLSPDQLSNDIRIGLMPTRTALQWLHRDGRPSTRPGLLCQNTLD